MPRSARSHGGALRDSRRPVEAGALAPPRAAALGAWVGAQVAFAGNAAFTFADAGASARVVAALPDHRRDRRACSASRWSSAAFGVGLHYLLAQVVATLINLVVTFEINRRWSFAAATSPRR